MEIRVKEKIFIERKHDYDKERLFEARDDGF